MITAEEASELRYKNLMLDADSRIRAVAGAGGEKVRINCDRYAERLKDELSGLGYSVSDFDIDEFGYATVLVGWVPSE